MATHVAGVFASSTNADTPGAVPVQSNSTTATNPTWQVNDEHEPPNAVPAHPSVDNPFGRSDNKGEAVHGTGVQTNGVGSATHTGGWPLVASWQEGPLPDAA